VLCAFEQFEAMRWAGYCNASSSIISTGYRLAPQEGPVKFSEFPEDEYLRLCGEVSSAYMFSSEDLRRCSGRFPRVIAWLPLVLVLLCGCGEDPPPTSNPEYQHTLRALRDMQTARDQEWKEAQTKDTTCTPLDPNQYFEVFDQIRMADGYVLDYVCDTTIMGMIPVLYARELDAEKISDIKQLEKEFGYRYAWGVGDTLDRCFSGKVVAEDNAAGFFQLAALSLVGDQFYRWWHGNYSDAVIICDQARMKEVLQDLENRFEGDIETWGREKKLRKQYRRIEARALKLDLAPEIVLGEDTVKASFVYFTKWGGFIRADWEVSRRFPHKEIAFTKATLVPYDCGVSF